MENMVTSTATLIAIDDSSYENGSITFQKKRNI